MERLGDRPDHQRLGQTGNTDQKSVSAGEHRNQDFIERIPLPDDPLPYFRADPDGRCDKRVAINVLVRHVAFPQRLCRGQRTGRRRREVTRSVDPLSTPAVDSDAVSSSTSKPRSFVTKKAASDPGMSVSSARSFTVSTGVSGGASTRTVSHTSGTCTRTVITGEPAVPRRMTSGRARSWATNGVVTLEPGVEEA